MLWVKAFHIVFVASWFAGLFYLPRLFVNLAMVEPASHAERERLLLMARKLHRFSSGLMLIAALFLLWWKSKSPWLLVSIGAEGVSLLLRLVLVATPNLFTGMPMLSMIWSFTFIAMAGGLLAYAVADTTQRPS